MKRQVTGDTRLFALVPGYHVLLLTLRDGVYLIGPEGAPPSIRVPDGIPVPSVAEGETIWVL